MEAMMKCVAYETVSTSGDQILPLDSIGGKRYFNTLIDAIVYYIVEDFEQEEDFEGNKRFHKAINANTRISVVIEKEDFMPFVAFETLRKNGKIIIDADNFSGKRDFDTLENAVAYYTKKGFEPMPDYENKKTFQKFIDVHEHAFVIIKERFVVRIFE
jgi:hypothetical protein